MDIGNKPPPDARQAADAAGVILAQALSWWGQCIVLSWQSLIAWPLVSAELQGQAWDSWVAHWGGGVPLDG
ncbi:MAG TPA: hypothetical protein VIN58_19690 [Roseateles sp.]